MPWGRRRPSSSKAAAAARRTSTTSSTRGLACAGSSRNCSALRRSTLRVTASTTMGCQIVLSGLRLEPGDEIVTTDEEHFGLLGPLHVSGARVRVAATRGRNADEALAAVLAEVGPRTRLVALSHVSWMTGHILPVGAIKAETGLPLLVDGAQSIGAIPVDVGEADFYTVSGQKWLCGPDATGALYVRDLDALAVALPTYWSREAHEPDGTFAPVESAQRFDTGPIPVPSLAGLEVALRTAPPSRYEAARALTERSRQLLSDRFDIVTAPNQGTLVTFVPEGESADDRRSPVRRRRRRQGHSRHRLGPRLVRLLEHRGARAAASRLPQRSGWRCSSGAGTSSTAGHIRPGGERTSRKRSRSPRGDAPDVLVSRSSPCGRYAVWRRGAAWQCSPPGRATGSGGWDAGRLISTTASSARLSRDRRTRPRRPPPCRDGPPHDASSTDVCVREAAIAWGFAWQWRVESGGAGARSIVALHLLLTLAHCATARRTSCVGRPLRGGAGRRRRAARGCG